MKTSRMFLMNLVVMFMIFCFSLIPVGVVQADDDEIVGTWRVTICLPGTTVKDCKNAQASTSGGFFPIHTYVIFNEGNTFTSESDIAEDHTGHGIWKQLSGNRFAFMYELWEYLPPLGDDDRADEAQRVRATITLNKTGNRFRGTGSFDELDRNRRNPVTIAIHGVIVGQRMMLIRENVVFP